MPMDSGEGAGAAARSATPSWREARFLGQTLRSLSNTHFTDEETEARGVSSPVLELPSLDCCLSSLPALPNFLQGCRTETKLG